MDDPTTTATTATDAATTAKPRAKRAPRQTRPLSANEMAAQLSRRFGVTVTAKSVRQWCRDNVAKYGDDRYTVHAYDAATVKRIVAAWQTRTARRTASKNGGKS